jgi:NTE family protein
VSGAAEPKRINVALQGGGSHGAFTWGVLDRLALPAQPFGLHPLRGVFEARVDFPALRGRERVELFLCAANVRTCRIEGFNDPEPAVEAVLPSACLPFLF